VSEKDSTDLPEHAAEFEKLAPEKQLSLTQEFFVFVMENKKWWLVPILLVFSIVGVASLVGALSAGWLSDRLGKLPVALAGSAALAFFLIVVPETAGALFYLTLGLVGLSMAGRVAPLQSLVTQLVSAEERGAYIALRNTLSQGGSATAAALASVLYGYGFHYICWMTSGFSIAALLLLLLIDEPSAES